MDTILRTAEGRNEADRGSEEDDCALQGRYSLDQMVNRSNPIVRVDGSEELHVASVKLDWMV